MGATGEKIADPRNNVGFQIEIEEFLEEDRMADGITKFYCLQIYRLMEG